MLGLTRHGRVEGLRIIRNFFLLFFGSKCNWNNKLNQLGAKEVCTMFGRSSLMIRKTFLSAVFFPSPSLTPFDSQFDEWWARSSVDVYTRVTPKWNFSPEEMDRSRLESFSLQRSIKWASDDSQCEVCLRRSLTFQPLSSLYHFIYYFISPKKV